jgi:hemerythrin-like domain-containing protein
MMIELGNLNQIFGYVAIIVGCGAAMMLVKLLFNNMTQQEKFFEGLAACHKQLQDASRKLETVCTLLDRRFANIEDNKRQPDPQLNSYLQRFDKTSQEIKARLNQLIEDGLSNTNGEPASAQTIIDEVINLRNNFEELSEQLRNNTPPNEDDDMATLKKRIESYQSMVMKARAEAKENETIMAQLRDEIAQLKNGERENPDNAHVKNEVELQTQLQTLSSEKQVLQTKLESVMDELHRNNIEKNFIEERFIELS